MSNPSVIDVNLRPRRGWRPWVIGVGISVLVVLALGVGWHLYQRSAADRRLGEAIAALDAADPGCAWRRSKRIGRSCRTRSTGCSTGRARCDAETVAGAPAEPEWNNLPPPQRLDAKTADAYRAERDKHLEAVALARRMTEFERGRHQIEYAEDYFSTKLPHCDASREIGWLLGIDAILLRARRGRNGRSASPAAGWSTSRDRSGTNRWPFRCWFASL
jgi:hypothetical protein